MKTLTVAQPWAALITHGHKRLETRPSPPNGPMRPDGVRGLPGLAIEPGERIAIHASASTAGWGRARRAIVSGGTRTQVGEWEVERDAAGLMLRGPIGWPYRLPLGAVVATAVVTDALPIVCSLGGPDDPLPRVCNLSAEGRGLRLMRFGEFPSADISHELPLGDYTPGRWAWVLDDVRPLAKPIPCKGRQGVWRLPRRVVEAIG